MGARASNDEWARRHFNNRSYQPLQGLEIPKNAVVAHLATRIGDQRLVVGWRHGYDLASLGLGVTSVMAIDFATDPVVRKLMQELLKVQGNAPAETVDFIIINPALPSPITMACALFTRTKFYLRHATIPERDVLRDASFSAAIWRLLGNTIVEEGPGVDTRLVVLNAVCVGAGQPLDRVLDARQTDPADQRVALPQTTLRGEP